MSCLPVRTVVEKLIVSGGLWLFFLFPHAHTHDDMKSEPWMGLWNHRWEPKQVRDPSVPGSCHCEIRSVIIGWRLLIHFFLQTSIVKIICLVEIPTHTQLFLLYAVFWANLSVQSSVYRLFDIFKPYVCCIPLFSYGLDIRIHAEKRERERGGGCLLLLQCGIYKVASRMMLYLCFIAHDVSGRRSYSSVHSCI